LQQIVAQKHQSLENGMLFVRITNILSAMVRLPIVVMGLLLVVFSAPIQQSLASSRTLDFTVYSDGSTHVFYELDANPFEPEFTVELFGQVIENVTIMDEDGFLLSYEINGNIALVETFGALHITIDYDTQDLISKTGKIWNFSVDTPIQYSLLIPKDSVIVEMSNFPVSMQVDNDQSYLVLPEGQTNISYYFSTLASTKPVQAVSEEDTNDNSLVIYVVAIIATGIAAVVAIKKSKSSKVIEPSVVIEKEEPEPQRLDSETIFQAKPDLREDDKEIINFLSANGGQAYESELRKKFLQPRTTMWRAVKRLERYGIIEIEKKDLQNIVKLKSKLEDN
tara:strand:+ start:119 stop:1129 length:1011 start_codon:yes stop_codon:yes gene_type:complete